MLRLGSMCSGIGGLDMAVEAVTDAEPAWFCEVDPSASQVLAQRWPDVPNLGDLTTATLPDVDVLSAGFPCQPVSSAGKRAGTDDGRWLFDDILAAVGRMGSRPRLLVFENVPGLLSANGGDAMARVVQGLAEAGFVGCYGVLGSGAVGGCHRRDRVWIVAADTDGGRVPARHAGGWRVPVHHPHDSATLLPTPTSRDHKGANQRGDTTRLTGAVAIFGQYQEAVTRWATTLGRPAPPPTITVKGSPRLNPDFVEWMMGYPEGWTAGLSRTQRLKVLGNAVQPQTAMAALPQLLARLPG